VMGFPTLMARMVGFPSWILTNHRNSNGKPIVYLYDEVLGHVAVLGFQTDPVIPGSNFPYGFEVEGDKP
jgi:hypothetical protein